MFMFIYVRYFMGGIFAIWAVLLKEPSKNQVLK